MERIHYITSIENHPEYGTFSDYASNPAELTAIYDEAFGVGNWELVSITDNKVVIRRK